MKRSKPLRTKSRRLRQRERNEVAVLAPYRTAGRCEWCGVRCRERDPAHIVSRGAGGPTNEANLVALCRDCHTNHHAGLNPTRAELFAVIGRMVGQPGEVIEECVRYLIREKTRGAL